MAKIRRYKSLTVDRVDLVNRGANFDRATGDGSHILLVKRDEQPITPQEHPTMADPNTEAVNKRIADLEALVAKQAADNAAAIAKAVADAKAEAEAKASTEKAEIEKRAAALETEVKAAKAATEAEIEKREIADAVAKAADLGYVLKADTDGPLMFRIGKALVAEDKARIDEILRSANEQIRLGKLFAEAGRTGVPPTGDASGNPEQRLLAKAEELRTANPKLSSADAVDQARQQFPTLRREYDEWKSAQINPTAAR